MKIQYNLNEVNERFIASVDRLPECLKARYNKFESLSGRGCLTIEIDSIFNTDFNIVNNNISAMGVSIESVAVNIYTKYIPGFKVLREQESIIPSKFLANYIDEEKMVVSFLSLPNDLVDDIKIALDNISLIENKVFNNPPRRKRFLIF